MMRLEQLEARMRAVDTKLAELETGLRQDVTTLKALIGALREQAADPAVLSNLEALATSIETRTAVLSVLDQETPPPTPPV
jgi:signal transduction histidine kinase